jgi:hypothetical protein
MFGLRVTPSASTTPPSWRPSHPYREMALRHQGEFNAGTTPVGGAEQRSARGPRLGPPPVARLAAFLPPVQILHP